MSGDSLPVRGGIAINGKQSLTSADAAAQLTRTGLRWGSTGEPSVTVTYAYRPSGTVPVDGGATFYTFNPQQIAATELALSSWSDVANIRFTRVGSGTGTDAYSGNATILFGGYIANQDDGGAAFANFPGSRSPFSSAGDVWVAANLSYNRTPVVGEYGQQVLVHEIGHAIGLSHPSDYDASDDTDPTYAANASYYEDARQYTVMSYFASSNTGATLGAFAAAPQIDDIAAAQRLYGANYATRAGDTTYGFNSNADRPYYVATSAATPLVFAVWDGGGYDRFDFSGYSQNQTIDLRQGAFSDVGGWVHNVSIAVGAVIEEAIGGSGNDTLIANDNSDYLYGANGSDIVRGGAGNDHLYGGRPGVAGDSADTITGGDGSDYLQGNAGDDSLSGGNGSDRVFGGQGNDLLFGQDGNDTMGGAMGNDQLDGGAGNDSLRGGQGDDTLSGGDGNDVLGGGQGNDRLDGGAGLDVQTGGAGADVFVMGGGVLSTGPVAAMADIVTDFEDGIDHLITGRPTASAYLLYGMIQATDTAASIVAYAQQQLYAPGVGVNAVLAVGGDGDTLVFSRSVPGGDLYAVRLTGIGDPHLISLDDFI